MLNPFLREKDFFGNRGNFCQINRNWKHAETAFLGEKYFGSVLGFLFREENI